MFTEEAPLAILKADVHEHNLAKYRAILGQNVIGICCQNHFDIYFSQNRVIFFSSYRALLWEQQRGGKNKLENSANCKFQLGRKVFL